MANEMICWEPGTFQNPR